MTGLPHRDDAQQAWLGQDVEPAEVDLSAIHRDAEKLDRTVHRRNRREVVAGIVAIVFMLGAAVHLHPRVGDFWLTVGLVLVSLGMAVTMWILLSYGKAPEGADPCNATSGYLADYRRKLKLEIRLLRWVPFWYIGPCLPGSLLVLWRIHYVFVSHHIPLGPWWTTVSGFVVAFLVVILLNIFAARKLERELETLRE